MSALRPFMVLALLTLLLGALGAADAPPGKPAETAAPVTTSNGAATTTAELAASSLRDPSVTPAKPVPTLNLGPLTVAVSPEAGGKGMSTAMSIILLITVLAVAPGFLMMMTSFTRVIIVLGFLRRALGTQTLPPNQVMVGLALFLTMFIMAPTFKRVNDEALQPYLKDQIAQEQALDRAKSALRDFMAKQTRKGDLALFIRLSGEQRPHSIDEVAFTALVPAFVTSELKTAFQMGFIIFLPFLVIDLVTSAVLMAMGMMMLPPSVVSLPFKILLFVLVDGWTLLMQGLVASYG
jgi:flagellar biosynthetic protein FliP